MNKICFNGCSFSVGSEFSDHQRENFIYDRLLEKKFLFKRTNIASDGSSNYNIFMRSANAISKGYDVVVTQWSALNRIVLCPGPDTYFFSNTNFDQYHYRDIFLDKDTLKKFIELLLLMNHDYKNIFDLIDYCNILIQLGAIHQTKIVFINGLVPWTRELQLEKTDTDDLTNFLSPYTKKILDFDNRHDEEIVSFYSVLKEKFRELDQSKWVNLFDPFLKNCVDKAPDGIHPGIKSHGIMADKVAEFFIKNSILI